jgi:alcohol dehydrogenase
MIAFGKAIRAPTTLAELLRWDDTYVDKILTAAKDPQLDMKLKNMPVPLTAAKVDEYLGPIIRAAINGDLSLIRSLQ